MKSQKSDEGLTLTFKKPRAWTDLFLGESIATDGACLTIAALRDDQYDCLLMPETLQKTTFGKHVPELVNLERALRAGDRFGGHFVQGHVDCVGRVTRIEKSDGYRLWLEYPENLHELIIEKGSVTINGVALTVIGETKGSFSVALIPHTLQNTTFGTLKLSDQVNIEFDMLGKYAVKVLDKRA